jgi:GNAT superfamily N-acetyltransferase
MSLTAIEVHLGDAPDVRAFLDERIYEYNAQATGCLDGANFHCTQRDESGAIRAGIFGYTWAGCCYVSHLWVDATRRGRGVGAALLAAAEAHARVRHCSVVFVDTHSFQAPGFYERMGYAEEALVRDHPVGHTNTTFVKRL